MSDADVVVTLTREQANALLVAASFGKPPSDDPALDEAIHALSRALSPGAA